MAKNIEQELKEMLVERLFLKITPEEIDSEKNLMSEYGIDSVSILEMVVGIEELYDVRLEPGEFKLEYFETIKNMAEFVGSKIES